MKTPLISAKIFKIIGSAIFLIILIHTFLNQSLTERFIAKQICLRGESLAYPLKERVNAILSILKNKKSLYGLSIMCKTIKESVPDVVEVCVMDSQGLILAHDDVKKVGTLVSGIPRPNFNKSFFCNNSSSIDTYGIIRHASIRDPLFIKVAISKEQLKQESQKAFIAAVIYMAFLFPIFLGIIYILTNIIFGKKIAQMVQGFQSLAAGKLDVRLNPVIQDDSKPNERDELDFLMDSFDRMAQKLEDFDYRRQKQEEQLAFLAHHDQLTTLPNRRMLEETMEKAINRARRGHMSVFMLMDLDNFKYINDTYGHSAGDKVLIDVASILQRMLRSTDFLARLGGDEFALVLEDVNVIKEAQMIADRMNQAMAEYRSGNPNYFFSVSFSIGITLIDGETDSETIMAQADTAMYTAKKMGRNRAVVYEKGSKDQADLSRVNEWVSKIKDALENDRFILFFQPVYQLHDSQVDYYEVLLRLSDSSGALFTPGDFFPTAEQFGFMSQIDRMVFNKAIDILLNNPNLKLYINISANSLTDKELIEYIAKKIMELQIEPCRIGFEFAEAAVLKEMTHAERWFRILHRLGCPLALDDFGLTFNSLQYLKKLPINRIKLDGYFIRSLDSEASQDVFIKAMHNLATDMGMETIAESVENENVLNILKQIGIHYAQGYHLGKPGQQYPKD